MKASQERRGRCNFHKDVNERKKKKNTRNLEKRCALFVYFPPFQFFLLLTASLLCLSEGQPDSDPRGEGDPSGVGPVPAALRPLHALHPGGAGRVRLLLLRAPALPPPHEGEAGQPGN